MKPGTTPKQRDIVLVPIPFTDLTANKRRPVLVLSNNSYNQQSQDVLVCAITSKIQNNKKYALIIEGKDLEGGLLPKTSQIRTDKIYSIHQNLILKRYGSIKLETFKKVTHILNELVQT